MQMYGFLIPFTLHEAKRDEVEAAAHDLMEELLRIEKMGNGTHSAAVSADLGQSRVEVDLAADAPDQETARELVLSTVRSAIHTIGGHQDPQTWAPAAEAELRVEALYG